VLLAALFLVTGGFACIALSMRKHCLQALGSIPPPRPLLVRRAIGWLLLGGALAACIARDGTSIGIVSWAALLTVGALLVTLLLTYRSPSPARRL
jgi:hypothetical protein